MPEVHCWAGERDWIVQAYGWGSREHGESYARPDGTCLLPDGHEGPHVWTPDDEITIEFVEGEEASPCGSR